MSIYKNSCISINKQFAMIMNHLGFWQNAATQCALHNHTYYLRESRFEWPWPFGFVEGEVCESDTKSYHTRVIFKVTQMAHIPRTFDDVSIFGNRWICVECDDSLGFTIKLLRI